LSYRIQSLNTFTNPPQPASRQLPHWETLPTCAFRCPTANSRLVLAPSPDPDTLFFHGWPLLGLCPISTTTRDRLGPGRDRRFAIYAQAQDKSLTDGQAGDRLLSVLGSQFSLALGWHAWGWTPEPGQLQLVHSSPHGRPCLRAEAQLTCAFNPNMGVSGLPDASQAHTNFLRSREEA